MRLRGYFPMQKVRNGHYNEITLKRIKKNTVWLMKVGSYLEKFLYIYFL